MRSQWRTWLISAVALGAVTVGTTAVASGPEPAGSPAAHPATPVEGAEITIALGSEPTSLDPHLVDDGGERAINDNIYETLLTRTPDGELAPGLATDLPTQVDDTTWEFTLREGVTFHNGEPFNADSVVATINRMVGLVERGETDNDGFYATLVGAEAVDEYTVRIMTDGPDGVLPARMYWLKQIPASAEETPDMSDEPIGTGPYRFESRNQGVDIVLVANEDYWGEGGTIGQVTYEFSDDAATRLAGLKSERYDLITNLAPSDVEQAPAFASRPGPGAPDPDPRRRRGHHRRPERPRGPQPRRRQGRHRREHVRRVRHGRRRPAAVAVDPRLQRRPRAARATTPRRPSACSRRPASAGRRSSWSASRGAGSVTASCSRRSPATGRPSASTCSSRSSSSAPTSTCSSTGRTGPTRSTCRAPTTCSTPTASCRRTTRQAASARRTATRRWPR